MRGEIVLVICCMSSSLILSAVCFPFMLGLFGPSKVKTPTDLLYVAIFKNDLAAIKNALDNGADPNGGKPEQGDYGYKHNTPLAAACVSKNLEVIKLLIARGADVNGRSGALAGVTPLEVAVAPMAEELSANSKLAAVTQAASRRLTVVRLLLEKGADPRINSRLGSNALTAAAGNGSLEIVELLISKRAPVNGSTALDQPLAEAAKLRKPVSAKIIETLISHGAKTGTPVPPNMETALHIAAARGNTDAARALLEHGAKVDARDRFGATPLHGAVMRNHIATAKLLLEHQASARAEDMEGRAPVMLAKGDEMKALFKAEKK